MNGDDLAGGEAHTPNVVDEMLKKEHWVFWWGRLLTWITLALVLLFYTGLLLFIFCKTFRPHTLSDIPIIISLATVPTLLLIALLRFFHHRDKPEAKEEEQPLLPINAQGLAEILKAVNTATSTKH